MGNLSLSHLQNGVVGNTSPAGDNTPDHVAGDGYGSEDFVPGSSSSRERKKGIPWTEEEHRMFLLGLQKLGKGDWRGIARNYVKSRTPTQVASHAQKYFIRQTNMSRRKRRSSLFDIVADESGDTPMVSHEFLSPHPPPESETENNNPFPQAPVIDEEECESMASTNSNDTEPGLPSFEQPSETNYPNDTTSQNGYPLTDTPQTYYPVVYPTFASPFYPFPTPFWTGHVPEPPKEAHEVVKPTAVHSKSPINVDELVGMSKLSLGETIGSGEKSTLSLKLLQGSSRQSAFHAKPGSSSSDMNSSSSSPIRA